MIAHIHGTIIHTGEKACIVQTPSGLGYEVYLSPRTLQAMPGTGEEARFYISTVVREDALDLYGFLSLEERETFRILLSTPKLGPKTALAILGIFSPDQLKSVVSAEDERMLSQVPGIGVKSARRILMDLRDRLNFIAAGMKSPERAAAPPVREEVLMGLTSLGYSPVEVSHIVDQVLKNEPDLDISSAIRAVLKEKAKST